VNEIDKPKVVCLISGNVKQFSCCVGAKYDAQGFAAYSQHETACACKWHGVDLGGFLLSAMSDFGANAHDGARRHGGAGGSGGAACSVSTTQRLVRNSAPSGPPVR
jgi:hypothetical protein